MLSILEKSKIELKKSIWHWVGSLNSQAYKDGSLSTFTLFNPLDHFKQLNLIKIKLLHYIKILKINILISVMILLLGILMLEKDMNITQVVIILFLTLLKHLQQMLIDIML